jgi:hypothetical protein
MWTFPVVYSDFRGTVYSVYRVFIFKKRFDKSESQLLLQNACKCSLIWLCTNEIFFKVWNVML